MTWVLVIGAAWLLLATLVAVVIGRSVRLADEKAAADAVVDEPNFAVDPATSPRGVPAPTVLPFAAPGEADGRTAAAQPVVRHTPTVPGIPAARPPAPGAGNVGGQAGPVRRSGLA